MVCLGVERGWRRMGKPAYGENRSHLVYGQRSASSPPWRGFFLRAFIQTLDSKSHAPVQRLSEIKLRRKECSRRPVRWAP